MHINYRRRGKNLGTLEFLPVRSANRVLSLFGGKRFPQETGLLWCDLVYRIHTVVPGAEVPT